MSLFATALILCHYIVTIVSLMLPLDPHASEFKLFTVAKDDTKMSACMCTF
jgi:hypothetical protein